jgi:hypothetical protein
MGANVFRLAPKNGHVRTASRLALNGGAVQGATRAVGNWGRLKLPHVVAKWSRRTRRLQLQKEPQSANACGSPGSKMQYLSKAYPAPVT